MTSDATRTSEKLRELVRQWGRGEYSDAHIIEDLTDFAAGLERELSQLRAELAASNQIRDRLESDLVQVRSELNSLKDTKHDKQPS